MKILQIAPQVPLPLDDGGKLSIYGITKSLAKLGHKIHFVCYRKNTDRDWAQKELEKICIPHILDVQTENRVFPALLNFFSPVPYNISKFIRKEMENFLIDFFKDNNVDIVHIDHLHLAWTVEVLRKITTAPVILREHNFETNIMKRFSEYQKNIILKKYSEIQFKKLNKYEPEICSKFDKCIMITRKDEEEILSLNSSIKTTVISAGVEKSLLNLAVGVPKERCSLFHLGPLEWLPNLDGLQWFVERIFPKIIEKFPDVRLYIYGKDSENFEVSALLSKNIMKVGYVENLWAELKNKQLCVVPLRIGSGIRLKILELLAQGHNIVTTSIGKEGIDATDGKELIVADSESEFVEKIEAYFNGGYNNNELSLNSVELIKKKYCWETIGAHFEEEYLKLLK
ncbi:MAG: glycosyltransferase family 4 protein [Ignavibacteriaceae bacterium]